MALIRQHPVFNVPQKLSLNTDSDSSPPLSQVLPYLSHHFCWFCKQATKTGFVIFHGFHLLSAMGTFLMGFHRSPGGLRARPREEVPGLCHQQPHALPGQNHRVIIESMNDRTVWVGRSKTRPSSDSPLHTVHHCYSQDCWSEMSSSLTPFVL